MLMILQNIQNLLTVSQSRREQCGTKTSKSQIQRLLRWDEGSRERNDLPGHAGNGEAGQTAAAFRVGEGAHRGRGVVGQVREDRAQRREEGADGEQTRGERASVRPFGLVREGGYSS